MTTTRSSGEVNSPVDRLVQMIDEYKIVVVPLLLGLSLIVLGWLLDLVSTVSAGTELYAEAGIAAATGIILCAITVFVYVVFWSLGRFGH